jgi:hypothetical protein
MTLLPRRGRVDQEWSGEQVGEEPVQEPPLLGRELVPDRRRWDRQ